MYHTNTLSEQPAAPAFVTVAGLIAMIQADDGIPTKRRADMCSGMRSLCRALSLQPESTPADPSLLTAQLSGLTPAAAGMSKGRLQNCKSHMDAALAYADARFRRRRSRTPLPAHLSEFLDTVSDRWKRTKLRRFMHFLGEQGIAVEDVDGRTFDILRESLERSLVKDPRGHDREVRKLWNELFVEAPERRVVVPSYTDHYTLPEAAFPASLWQDLAGYIASRTVNPGTELDGLLTEEELFGDDQPSAPPIRPSTVKLIRYRVRQFASILVRSGVMKPDEITTLEHLVVPKIVAAGLNILIKRTGGERRNSQIKGIASDLLMIARLWARSPEDDLKKLGQIVVKVRPVHQGLPERVRRKLAPFRDVENVRAFLFLSDRIVREALREKVITREMANRVATALWIRIAQRAPLRITNLLATDLTANLLRSHGGKNAKVALFYPPEQVKNGKTLEIPLSASTVKLLDLYLSTFRPILVGTPCNWLFPTSSGDHKLPSVMSSDIQKLMREHLGFSINPHSFRHLAAKLYLTAHPGRYADVQLLLGHRKLQTTISYYIDLEAEEAFRHFDAVLLGLEESPTVRVKEKA